MNKKIFYSILVIAIFLLPYQALCQTTVIESIINISIGVTIP